MSEAVETSKPSDTVQDSNNWEGLYLKEKEKCEGLKLKNTQLEKKVNDLEETQKQYQSGVEKKLRKYEHSLDRLSQELWEIKGDSLFTESSLNEAIEFCQSIIKTSPKHDYQIQGLGNIQDQIGVYQESIFDWYKQNKNLNKIRSNPYDVLSLCFSFKQNYSEAQAWYSHRLSKNHDSYQLLLGLANLEYNNGKYEEAEKLYKRAIELKPELDKPYQQIAFIKSLKQNKKEEAREWVHKALDKNAQNYYADYILAISTDNPETQIQRLVRLSEKQKDYARIYNGLGNIHKNKKSYEEAMKWFKKSIEVNPKYQAPYYGIGTIHIQQAQEEEAINWFQETVKVNPKYDNVYYGLACVYTKKGDNEEAVKWHLKCIEVNPRYVQSMNALAMIHALKQNFDEAIKWYNKCLEINPKYNFPYNGLGNIHFKKGELDEAIAWFTKCIEINPKYGAPYNGLSNVFVKKGDEEEAKKWYEKKVAALKAE